MEEKLVRYEKIRRELARKIRVGDYPPGTLLPSEMELTQLYSVSRITVSKALSLLREDGYISRVQGKGTYAAPREDWDRPGTADTVFGSDIPPRKVGLILPMLGDLHGLEIVHGVSEALALPDYLLLTKVSRDQEGEELSLQWFRGQGFDGVIVFPVDSELYSEAILSMQLARYPYVLVDRYFPGVNSNLVSADNLLGGELATEHLLKLGHRDIAFCASCPLSEQATALRYEGYCKAVRGRGLLPVDCLPLSKPSQEREFLLEALSEAVSKGSLTAAVASNVFTANLILESCGSRGIRVPEDFSIVCFDRPSLGPAETSFFTYVDQRSYEMGRRAGALLAGLLSCPKEQPAPAQLILKPELIPGRSTGPCKERG